MIIKRCLLQLTCVAILCVTQAAMAASYYPAPLACISERISLPCDNPGFAVGFEGNIIQAGNSDLSYIKDSISDAEVVSIDPSSAYAFLLEAAYYFEQGSSLVLQWRHFDKSDKTYPLNKGGAFYPIGLNFTAPIDSVRADTRFVLDRINLAFGQQVYAGRTLHLRGHYGLSYANIRHRFMVSAEDFSEPLLMAQTDEMHTRFDGMGPLGGVDAAYELGSDFQLRLHTSAALLLGEARYREDRTIYNISSVSDDVYQRTTLRLSEWIVVPTLSARVGLGYVNDQFTAEAGWMFQTYMGVIKHHPNDLNDSEGAIVHSQPSNFTLDGPYVKLKYVM